MMHEREKSDTAVVAVKPTNKAGTTAAESVDEVGAVVALVGADGETALRALPLVVSLLLSGIVSMFGLGVLSLLSGFAGLVSSAPPVPGASGGARSGGPGGAFGCRLIIDPHAKINMLERYPLADLGPPRPPGCTS